MTELSTGVEVEEREGFALVRIVGEVDIANAGEVGRSLDGATERPIDRFVVDLGATSYLDSAGIRLLFVLATRLRERRKEMAVVAPSSGIVRRVLDLVDLRSVVPVYDSLDEAIA